MFGYKESGDIVLWGYVSEESRLRDAEYWDRLSREKKLEVLASTCCRLIEDNHALDKLPKHIQEWWKYHKEWDDARIRNEEREEDARKEILRIKAEALAKLNSIERRT
jgi:hypothetical protein